MFEKSPSNSTIKDEIVRPAFDTAWQMFAFLSLVALTLGLPVLLAFSGKITRRSSYEIMPENQGAFSFVRNEIFDNSEPIDLLFVGSSVTFGGIDAPQVERALSEKIGRPARVMTFGHYFNSLDIVYMQVRDLLERKKVRMIFLSVPRLPYPEGPSPIAYRFMRYNEAPEVFGALPIQSRLSIYACSVLRSPRDVLSLIRPNLGKNPSPFAKNLGADKADWGAMRAPLKFVRYAPPAPFVRIEDLIYSRETADRFLFSGEDIPLHQKIYLEKLVELLRREKVPFAMINIPQNTERLSTKIIERRNWSEEFGAEIPIIGIPPAELFAGLSEKEIDLMYYDDMHFNTNGNEFYTKTILPAVLEVYEQQTANR
jgi:hypothetical protein